jgi:hypothetical protein
VSGLRYWAAAALAAAALIAGSAVAVTSYLRADDPAEVVRGYFAAVARGDAAAALGYGDLPAAASRLLTRDVLASQRSRAKIDVLTVVAVHRGGNAGGTDNVAEVDIRYQLAYRSGPTTVTDTVDVRRHGRSWRLGQAAVPVTLAMTQAQNRATIAGAAIPREPVALFPGALPVVFDTPNLDLAAPSPTVRFSAAGKLTVVPAVTPAARTAATAALTTAVARCLRGTGQADPSCPTPDDPRAVPGSLHGTVRTPVRDAVTVSVSDGADGLLDVSGWIRVAGQYAQLNFDNQKVAIAPKKAVQLSAHCYATDPATIAWDNS